MFQSRGDDMSTRVKEDNCRWEGDEETDSSGCSWTHFGWWTERRDDWLWERNKQEILTNKRFSHLKEISDAQQTQSETLSSSVSSPLPGQLSENRPFVTLWCNISGIVKYHSCQKSLCDDTFIGLVYGQWITNSDNFRRRQLYYCLSDVCLSKNSEYTRYLHHLLLSESALLMMNRKEEDELFWKGLVNIVVENWEKLNRIEKWSYEKCVFAIVLHILVQQFLVKRHTGMIYLHMIFLSAYHISICVWSPPGEGEKVIFGCCQLLGVSSLDTHIHFSHGSRQRESSTTLTTRANSQCKKCITAFNTHVRWKDAMWHMGGPVKMSC